MFQIRPPSKIQVRRSARRAGRLGLRAGASLLVSGLMVPMTMAQSPEAPTLSAALVTHVQQVAQAGARGSLPAQARVEVQVGALDPRLKLAPCALVQPYLPPGLQMWGRTRIGLRCVEGPVRWNVSLPVTVKVFAKALVAGDALAAGTQLTQALLATAEIDIAAESGGVFTDAASLNGRTLSRSLVAGETVRSGSLKARQWFAAGDTVMVRAAGPGYSVAREGQAMTMGLEGQNVKVRFESGRIVTGRVVGDRQVEVLL
ncbi:flagellar basal body P-ring formation chaperone FlgA [Paucibacter sp. AS339]|uniref:flagellar basal body P-ring formation chaperone FlgA n=1 Tax=Paucibacter hankyongi TaxID=3133434 RepID=UPI0030B17BA4